MIKRLLVLTTAVVLTVGTATIAYAKEKDEKTANKLTKTSSYEYRNIGNNNMQDAMIKIMEENGYKDLADEARKGNYEAIDEFMKNMTDADFQKMIDIMKENGYGGMANMMENIGREGMIQMHNSMGGAAACHGNNGNFRGMRGNGGMMRNFSIQ